MMGEIKVWMEKPEEWSEKETELFVRMFGQINKLYNDKITEDYNRDNLPKPPKSQ